MKFFSVAPVDGKNHYCFQKSWKMVSHIKILSDRFIFWILFYKSPKRHYNSGLDCKASGRETIAPEPVFEWHNGSYVWAIKKKRMNLYNVQYV